MSTGATRRRSVCAQAAIINVELSALRSAIVPPRRTGEGGRWRRRRSLARPP